MRAILLGPRPYDRSAVPIASPGRDDLLLPGSEYGRWVRAPVNQRVDAAAVKDREDRCREAWPAHHVRGVGASVPSLKGKDGIGVDACDDAFARYRSCFTPRDLGCRF